jgi:hypothetical protein
MINYRGVLFAGIVIIHYVERFYDQVSFSVCVIVVIVDALTGRQVPSCEAEPRLAKTFQTMDQYP